VSTPVPKTFPRNYRSTAIGRQKSNLTGWYDKYRGWPIPTGPWKYYRPGIQAAGYKVSTHTLYIGSSLTRYEYPQLGPGIKIFTLAPVAITIWQQLANSGNLPTWAGRFISKHGKLIVTEWIEPTFTAGLDYTWLSPYYQEYILPR
jgi:hypothetical protein